MLKITVKVDGMDEIAKAAQKFPTQGIDEVNRAIKNSILEIQRQAFRTTPVNKQTAGGNLRQSIKTKIGRLWGEVYTTVKYAIYVHEGTRPHIIQVVNKRILANRRTGQFFGKRVNHPGTRPNPFLKNALIRAKDNIQVFFNNALKNIVNLMR